MCGVHFCYNGTYGKQNGFSTRITEKKENFINEFCIIKSWKRHYTLLSAIPESQQILSLLITHKVPVMPVILT